LGMAISGEDVDDDRGQTHRIAQLL